MPSLHDLPAPAKLNLFLHVVGRRPDGYHLLQSVFVLLDWQDTLHIDTRDDGLLRRHDLNVPLPQDDLCLRAARLLQQESGTALGCDIRIHKEVPWGAGLGGGSSDAATVLLALNQLWGLHWPSARLEALALQLGADVPFFVRGLPAWVEGVGEQITPITLPPELLRTPLALLKPPAAIPTAAIFGSKLLKRDTTHATVADFLAAPMRFGHNDLQEPAQAWRATLSPDEDAALPGTRVSDGRDVAHALGVMQARFGNSRMTGSGSTVFAWVEGSEPVPEPRPDTLTSEDVAALAEAGPHGGHWVGRVCHVVPRHPLLDLLKQPCGA
ncbi:MAG: 4-(cytidine 5'-diphospho)-2-C-methyl-D-erythritol kinase [Proteobacteria bacterium]|uniref:4-(cytidine 5'-diphospho)-2-C-methyl-D-erythritol kinase n=1 Tax=Aquabacterium sp. TaxID=1872578 RepID=UPI0035C74212|nr:4-(cytidine 5'-diphospho)-2-C-methyl-D-erythritol kinase [Pseudomonadota bacterium]